ncbi:protein kinase [Candidatus Uabimicrobium sp. HlEnr_7]|uniref:protein kinase domain-containing protein n=1 Tax=Candidatus Uabimicrobium helgolandensis TaxID=3095367 RepID=UPI00355731E6
MNANVLEKKYYFEKTLYENAYYTDYQVWHNSWREYVVVRVIKNLYGTQEFLHEEAQTWIEVSSHPNIISAYFIKDIKEKPCLFIENTRGKNLTSIPLKYSTENFPQILEFAIQISQGMDYLHDERVVHSALLPDNIIILQNGRIKINNIRWEFGENLEGAARGLRSSFLQDPFDFDAQKIYKKFALLPPEYYLAQSFSWKENFPADVYSFGMLIYYMCSREFPFYFEGNLKKMFSFYARKYERNTVPTLKQKYSYISNEFSDLVSSCLSIDPKERPSFSRIKSSLHKIYESYTGINYIAENFPDTSLLSISLNNRALGEIDNDNADKAKSILRDVSLLHTDRISAILNLKLLQLRQQKISLRECLQATKDLQYIDLEKIVVFQSLICLEFGSFVQDMLDKIQQLPEKKYPLQLIEGCLYYRMGEYEKAKEIFRSEVKKEDATQELWYLMGASSLALQDEKSAHQAWHEGLNYPRPYFDLFLAYGMVITSMGDWSKAREYFEKGFHSDALTNQYPKNKWSHVRTFHIGKNIVDLAVTKNKKYISVTTIDGIENIWSWPKGEKQQQVQNTMQIPLSRTGRIHRSFFSQHMSDIVFGEKKEVGISIHGDSIIKIWNMKSHTCAHELRKHTKAVTSIAITNSGKTFVSGSLDKTVKVWSVETGECQLNLDGHQDCVNCVDISSEGDIAASGSWDKTVRVWDVLNGCCIATMENLYGDITSLSLSSDGSIAVSGDACGNVHILDVPSNTKIALLQGEKKSVTQVTLSHDKSIIIAGYVDGTIRVFEDISLRNCPCWMETPFVLDRLTQPVSLEKRQQIAFWRDKAENFVHNNKLDKALDFYKKILDATEQNLYLDTLKSVTALIKKNDALPRAINNHKLISIFYHESGIKDFLILNDDYFFSICNNSRLYRWQVAEKSCDVFWQKSKYNFSCFIMSPDKRNLCFGDNNHFVHLWTPETDNWTILEGHTNSITCLKIIGNTLISASSDGTIQFWDHQTGDPLGNCQSLDYITDLAITDDQSVIVSSSLQGNIKFWETESHKCILETNKTAGPTSQISILDFDKAEMVSCGTDGCLKVWSIRSGTCNNIYKVTDNEALTCMSISTQQKIALLGGDNGNIYIWDFEQEKCIKKIKAHTGKVVKVDLDSQGFSGYSAGSDGIIKLWAFEWRF